MLTVQQCGGLGTPVALCHSSSAQMPQGKGNVTLWHRLPSRAVGSRVRASHEP